MSLPNKIQERIERLRHVLGDDIPSTIEDSFDYGASLIATELVADLKLAMEALEKQCCCGEYAHGNNGGFRMEHIECEGCKLTAALKEKYGD